MLPTTTLSKALTAFLSLAATVSAVPQGGFGGGNEGGQQGGAASTTTSIQSSITASAANGAVSATTTASSSSSSSSSSSDSTACNNSPLLCDRSYNNVTYMGAHDSSFLRDDSTGNSVAGTQFLNATKALDAGLRFLQTQVHNKNGTLELCHGSCSILDAGTLEDWLVKIKYWMDNNPNEVVTLVLVNSDSNETAVYGSIFESSGISQYGYTPGSTSATSNWPTLRTMIEANTRLVTFVTNIDYDTNYSYILPEFDYVFETAYEVTSLSGFNCSIDRPTSLKDSTGGTAISSGYIPFLNHFAYSSLLGALIPDVSDIETTNNDDTSGTGYLGTHLQQCNSEWGSKPVLVLVDFWDQGDVMAASDALNGLTETTGRSVDSDSSSNSSSGATGAFGVGTGGALVTFLAAAIFMF